MIARGLFITGTDTGCGKTRVALALMGLYRARGLRVLGLKPVAAGAEQTLEGLRNSDALRLQAAGSLSLPYDWVNPYCFAPPIAPHLAAAEAGVAIRPPLLRAAYQRLAKRAQRVIVEGAGGWRVPLGPGLEIGDLPGLLGIPVLLVVGLRLGCLNQALLTVEAIQARGCPLAGWVANRVDPHMARVEENLATLRQRIPAPCLGLLAYKGNKTQWKCGLVG